MELVQKDSSISQILLEFGNEVQRAMQVNLKNSKANASGELSQSINFSSTILGNKFHFVLDMGVDYWKFVDEGRKPGKQPPLNDIIRWVNTKATFGGFSRVPNIRDKAVQKGLAFAIAKKIGKKGVKGNRFYSKVITDDRMKKLIRDLGQASKKDLQTIVKNTAQGVFGQSI